MLACAALALSAACDKRATDPLRGAAERGPVLEREAGMDTARSGAHEGGDSPAPDATDTNTAHADAGSSEVDCAGGEPRVGRSVGHTSVVFKLEFSTGSKAAYKPHAKRVEGRYRGEIAAHRFARALGIDNVPPAFVRLGRVLGAGPVALYRDIVLPAALPGYVSGLTQGWAFAWRSLMAGELLVIIAERPSLGASLEFARQFSQATLLLATMLVILVIGMVVDGIFSSFATRLRVRRGLSR